MSEKQINVRKATCSWCFKRACAALRLGGTPVYYCRACWMRSPETTANHKVYLDFVVGYADPDVVTVWQSRKGLFSLDCTVGAWLTLHSVHPSDVQFYDIIRISTYRLLLRAGAVGVNGRFWAPK